VKDRLPLISLVIPLFNEAESIPLLFKALNKLHAKLPTISEVIFVDDGSQDQTQDLVNATPLVFPKKLIQLSRNFGHQAALLAGLEHAKGEIVVTLDGDLQHPPSLIPEMLKQHQKGIDIVFTMRQDDASIPNIKKALSRGFYWVMDHLSATQIRHNASDFRSMNRMALQAVLNMPERRKFLRGMVGWVGFCSIILPFKVGQRASGESKYTISKMLRLAFDGLTSFSTMPLYFSAVVGFLLSILTLLYGIYVLYVSFILNAVVAGWSSVILVTLVIGSVLSFLLAILGVYVAAIYDEVKNRPVYIITNTNP